MVCPKTVTQGCSSEIHVFHYEELTPMLVNDLEEKRATIAILIPRHTAPAKLQVRAEVETQG